MGFVDEKFRVLGNAPTKKAYCWCFRNPGCFLKPSGECWDKAWIEMDKLLYTISSWTGRGHQQDMSYDLFFARMPATLLEWFLEASFSSMGFYHFFSPNSACHWPHHFPQKIRFHLPTGPNPSPSRPFLTHHAGHPKKVGFLRTECRGSVSEEIFGKSSNALYQKWTQVGSISSYPKFSASWDWS